jgi:hypothetical protein
MMNGISLGAEGVESDEMTKQFVDSVMELSGFWNRLSEWRKKEAQRLTEASGFSDLESVPLDRWFEANGASQGASVDAWCRFVGEDLPNLPDLDDLQQARQAHLERSAP